MTKQALLCDAVRTPIGRYGGSLSSIRTDDLAAIPLRALVTRTPQFDWAALDDVWLGCANQAGEDNRNIARMSSLLAGLPMSVPGVTLNRLCGSGMDAVGSAARAIKSGEIQCAIAGGVESMSRAPFVFGKAGAGFDRNIQTYDTTIGWRFVNKAFQKKWGTDSMPETAENVAEQFGVSRVDQDALLIGPTSAPSVHRPTELLMPNWSLWRCRSVEGEPLRVSGDEGPRSDTTLEKLATLPTPFRGGGVP